MYSLGIDIGTTSIATVIINKDLSILSTFSLNHNASIPSMDGISEQNPDILLFVIQTLINNHPIELLQKVQTISVTGQMHGVILWNTETKEHTNLITWQDQRASHNNLLKSIQQHPGCLELRDGFGFTTLSVLFKCMSMEKYNACGTIMDYLIWMMTGKLLIDQSNASSWGLYDIDLNEWNKNAIQSLGINLNILPKISRTGSDAGLLNNEFEQLYHMNKVVVKCSIGDNQASVLAAGRNFENEVYITFGTGCQISIVLDKSESLKLQHTPTFELRPFLRDKLLVVSAPLCGGKSWEILKDMAKDMIMQFTNQDLSDDEIYHRLNKMAFNEIDSSDLPSIAPHFLKERWDMNSKASITGLTQSNFTISKIAAALLIGMALNLKHNLPKKCFEKRNCIIANGNAIKKNKSLCKAIEKVFQMPVKLADSIEDAAMGAAILPLAQ